MPRRNRRASQDRNVSDRPLRRFEIRFHDPVQYRDRIVTYHICFAAEAADAYNAALTWTDEANIASVAEVAHTMPRDAFNGGDEKRH